jgi:integrase
LNLPGTHRVPKKRPGKVIIYWRLDRQKGAPILGRFEGATLEEAEKAEKAGEAALAKAYGEYLSAPKLNPAFMRSLIRDFERIEMPRLAASTQKVWRGHIREIEAFFGNTSLRALQAQPDEHGRGESARALIKAWHLKQSKPDAKGVPTQARTANIRLGVLVRLLNWGVDQERLQRNAAAKIERLGEGPGRASIVWKAEELTAFLKHCTPEVARGVRLAALTGLRMADVVGLSWAEIDGDVIRRPTSKSRRKQRAAIPLYPALRELLAECNPDNRQLGPVLLSTRGKGWRSADSFDSSLRPAIDAYRLAGGADKHFHDLRGNAATAMYQGGLPLRLIAGAFGWSEGEAENRINDYVDLSEAARIWAQANPGLQQSELVEENQGPSGERFTAEAS